MTIVTVSSSTLPTERHDFMFAHNARSWLILAGYLPLEDDPTMYQQMYTGNVAKVEVFR